MTLARADRVPGWRRWLVLACAIVAALWLAAVLIDLLRWLMRISVDRFLPARLVEVLVGIERWAGLAVVPLTWAVIALGLLELVVGVNGRMRMAGLCLAGAGVVVLVWRWVVATYLNTPVVGAEPTPTQTLARSMAPLGTVFLTLVALALVSLSMGYRRSIVVEEAGSGGVEDIIDER